MKLWGVGTPEECRNSRPPELPTHVGTPDPQQIWKPCNWVKEYEVPELPTHAGTSDRRNSRLTSELPTLEALENQPLASGRPYRTRPVWIPDTSGMTWTVNSPNYLNCESSELSTIAETSDRRNSRNTSELSTNQPENNTFTVTGQIPDTSGMARPATSQLALLSLKHSNLTWVGLSTYETLSINMMHPS